MRCRWETSSGFHFHFHALVFDLMLYQSALLGDVAATPRTRGREFLEILRRHSPYAITVTAGRAIYLLIIGAERLLNICSAIDRRFIVLSSDRRRVHLVSYRALLVEVILLEHHLHHLFVHARMLKNCPVASGVAGYIESTVCNSLVARPFLGRLAEKHVRCV